jgi:hypothetical protein
MSRQSRFYSQIQTSAMKSSILHSDSVEITADLTVSTVSESTKASPRRISPELRLSTSSSNAQIEKRASCNDYAYRRNLLSKRQTSPHRPSLYRTESFLTTDHFRYSFVQYRIVVDTPSVMTQNLSTKPRCNKRKIHVRFYRHENVIFPYEYRRVRYYRRSHSTREQHYRYSTISTTRDYFRTIRPRRRCTPYQRYRRRNFHWSCRVSEHTDRLDVGKRWNIYDTCHGFGVGV